MSGIHPFSTVNARQTAERAADVLLEAAGRISAFDVGCNSAEMNLTIYHLAAYGGLNSFIKTLLGSEQFLGVDVNCSNVHGITPLYLAKLHVGTQKRERDPWQKIVNLIEEHGGRLMYPNRKVELNVLYKHLFGGHLNHFELNQFEVPNERLYKSVVTQCRPHDLSHYETGTMRNPYEETLHDKLMRLISVDDPRTNLLLVPSDFTQLQTALKTLHTVKKMKEDMSHLYHDISRGFERAERVITRRKKEANTTFTASLTTLSHTFPKLNSINNDIREREQILWETRFSYESTKAITFHRNRYLKQILHQHSSVLEDIANVVEILEKYDESYLCMDEIFQAKFLILKFRDYILKSGTDDLLNLLRNTLSEAEFTSKRMPSEWKCKEEKKGWTPTWNRDVKFLYQQATQRDLTFDYLQVLSLGLDKDTRIPLNEEAFISLWVDG